jgi:hypothetical protein
MHATDAGLRAPRNSKGWEKGRRNVEAYHLQPSMKGRSPWQEPLRVLLTALVAEHEPRGPTEEHLVEELAGILWRKRRLRLAEAATVRRGLEGTFASYHRTVDVALALLDAADQPECVSTAVRATAADTDEDMADMAADETMTRRALELLASKRNDAYEAALAGLREDTQTWWADVLARDPDELERMSNQPPPMLRDYGGSSKARCWHGSKTAGRSWPTGR